MAYELLVGLSIKDAAGYQAYREAMTPILTSYGGKFTYDFLVSQVLKAEKGEAINRVFVISFPNEAVPSKFFDDPAYLKVKKQFFEQAVESITVIAEYKKRYRVPKGQATNEIN